MVSKKVRQKARQRAARREQVDSSSQQNSIPRIEQARQNESEVVRENRQKLDRARSDFAQVSEDDGNDYQNKKIQVVGAMNDYLLVKSEQKVEAPFLEAIQMAAEVREACNEADWNHTVAMYYQCSLSYGVYLINDDPSYLSMANTFGKESIQWIRDYNYKERGIAYSLRCELVAKVLKAQFDRGKQAIHLEQAVKYQRMSVYATDTSEYDNGNSVVYQRAKLWAALYVRLMDVRSNVDFDDLIHQLSVNFPCTLTTEPIAVAHNYWQIRLGLQCRLWARTRKVKDLKLLRQYASELLEFERHPPCDCHGNLDDPLFCSSPGDSNHVIRRAAGFFDEWFCLDEANSEWSKHLATINTSLSLWEEAYKTAPRLTFQDAKRDSVVVGNMSLRLWSKYLLTRSIKVGWQHDSKAWESAHLNNLCLSIEDESQRPSDLLESVYKNGTRFVANAMSVVTDQEYSIWGAPDTKKPMDLDNMRFKFLDSVYDAEHWIRERSADGKFFLGAEKPRDLDVFEFLAEFHKK